MVCFSPLYATNCGQEEAGTIWFRPLNMHSYDSHTWHIFSYKRTQPEVGVRVLGTSALTHSTVCTIPRLAAWLSLGATTPEPFGSGVGGTILYDRHIFVVCEA